MLKSISIISNYLKENTFFFMITDGLSHFNLTTANLFEAVLRRVKKNGCLAYSYCYFIKSNVGSLVPTQFKRVCGQIGGEVRSSVISDLRVVFEDDQREAVVKLSEGK